MKYFIKCEFCMDHYEVESEFAPYFCIKCGSGLIGINPGKSKARLRAEEAMRRLDELGPKLDAARKTYEELRDAYNDERQLLIEYKTRGHATEEEVARYKTAFNRKLGLK